MFSISSQTQLQCPQILLLKRKLRKTLLTVNHLNHIRHFLYINPKCGKSEWVKAQKRQNLLLINHRDDSSGTIESI